MHTTILVMIAAAEMVSLQPQSKPRRCAMPLLPVVKREVRDTMQVKPPDGALRILRAAPPAPPCEHWNK